MTVLYSVPSAAIPTGEFVLQSQFAPGAGSQYAVGELAAEEESSETITPEEESTETINLVGESTETINPVLPEVHEILWAAVFFILLWLLMKYVLLPPIRALQAVRKQKLQDDKDAAEQAALDYEHAKADYETALMTARQDANTLFEEVRGRASSRRQEIISEAAAAVAADRAAATTEIAEARQRAIDDLRPQLRTLAVQAATDVLGRTPSPDQQSAVDQYLAEIGGAGAATQEGTVN